MKIHTITGWFFLILVSACTTKQDAYKPSRKIITRKIVGEVNTAHHRAPDTILLSGARAPNILRAGKPDLIPNPNADGLGDPDFSYFNTTTGLPLDNITCSMIDKQGDLWFASIGGGVSRYDGKRFTTFAAVNGLDNGIYGMTQDVDGNCWFNSRDELIRKYDGSKFTAVSPYPLPMKDNLIQSVCADKKGNIWIASQAGAYQYGPAKNGSPALSTRLVAPDGFLDHYVGVVWEDREGRHWFGTDKGICRFDGKNFTVYTSGNGLINGAVNCFAEDLDGNIWIGTNKGTSKFDGKNFWNYTTADGLTGNKVAVIAADSHGTLWFGTSMGLSKYDAPEGGGARIFTNYTRQNGLPDNDVSSLIEDQAGNIWIGTARGGVCKYNWNHLSQFTPSLGLRGTAVHAVAQDKKGHMWFGTTGGGASEYDGKKFLHYGKKQGLPNDDVYSILQDKTGDLWFGCEAAISRFDGKRFINYTAAQGVPESEIWNIMQDDKSNIWFTSWFGTLKFDGRHFIHYTEAQGLFSNENLSIIQDKKRNVWISAYGLNKFDGNVFTNYLPANGMPNDKMPGMRMDAAGNIWIGTYGKGVCRLRDDSLTVFTTTQGMADNTVFSVREDSVDHRLWFGTNAGLSMLKENDLLRNDRDTILFENFNHATGFDIKDFSFNFSLFIDNKDVLWGGTGDGRLFRFDYNRLKLPEKPPHIQLENVAINNENICWHLLGPNASSKPRGDSLAILNEMITTFGKVLTEDETRRMQEKYHLLRFDSIAPFYPIPEKLVLAYPMNNIRIDFAAVDPAGGSQTKYQYLLQGYDRDWSPLGSSTSASFGNIREGTYLFRVKALTGSGLWSEAAYGFKVLPPWFRTWLAYVIYIICLVSAVFGFISYRSASLRSKNRALEEKVHLRTNQLQTSLVHLKSTQAQLIQSEKMASLGELTAGIAHEIQNPLNFVNNFSDVNKELLTELKHEIEKGNIREAKIIADDVIANEEKISHHGQRADGIVKGMLQHSRAGTGQKELTDINKLTEEYFRLAYHGLRAKDKNFNVTMTSDYDQRIGKINIAPQDIGRVILNLLTNAFYAVNEKSKQDIKEFEPSVTVTTKKLMDKVEIKIADNGNGIPEKNLEKIFQPFFTTKPAGQGTGLGLSLGYDIVMAHGGEIKVETKQQAGTTFTIKLPSDA